jgi:hypothetical protein
MCHMSDHSHRQHPSHANFLISFGFSYSEMTAFLKYFLFFFTVFARMKVCCNLWILVGERVCRLQRLFIKS